MNWNMPSWLVRLTCRGECSHAMSVEEETPCGVLQDASCPPVVDVKASENGDPGQCPAQVPGMVELETLRQRALDIETKNVPPKEAIRPRYKRQILEYLNSLEEGTSIEDPNLFLKGLAVECLWRLSLWHNEEAMRQGQAHDLQAVATWRRDEGRLLAATELIRGVVISENDWMHFE